VPGRLVLHDRRETGRRIEKEIVVRVVVDGGDFSDDGGPEAGLGIELMLDEGGQPDRLTGADDEAMTGRRAVQDSIDRDGDLGGVIESSILAAIENLAYQVAA
jgi:hypothetical protein